LFAQALSLVQPDAALPTKDFHNSIEMRVILQRSLWRTIV
jgi:hypothetical protein